MRPWTALSTCLYLVQDPCPHDLGEAIRYAQARPITPTTLLLYPSQFVVDPVTRVPFTPDVVLPVRSQEGWISRDNIHRQASLVLGRTRFGCWEL